MIAKRDPVTGLEQLTIQDDDNDEDEDASKKHQPTPEEIRQRQEREREEKQRRYDEARAKIFGDSNPSSGQSTPGTVTPPQQGDGRSNYRGGRAGRGRGGGGRPNNNRQDRQDDRRQPAPQPSGSRELFDPNYTSKPGFKQSSRSGTLREDDQVIRAPRGPDGNGRGGFNFARRSAQED